MRVWLDESGGMVHVEWTGRKSATYSPPPPSAVPLVTASSVVEQIRGELRGLQGMTPAAHRALAQVLDRAARSGSFDQTQTSLAVDKQ